MSSENDLHDLMLQLVEESKKNFQNNEQKSKIIKGVGYVQNLFNRSKICETETLSFKKLLEKCLITIKEEKNCLFADLLSAAQFLKKHQDSKPPSSTQKSEKTQILENSELQQPDQAEIINNQPVSSTDQDEKLNSPEEQISNEKEEPEDNSLETLNNLTDIEQKKLIRIKKLDTYCQLIHKKIYEYETMELSMDDLESAESAYVLEAKLKTRFVKAHKKLVSLCKSFPHLIRVEAKSLKKVGGQFSTKIKFESTRYKDLNSHIEHSINSSKEFPDYAEVFKWVTEANSKYDLGLDEKEIEELSKSAFEEIGRILKNRRIKDDRYILLTRIDSLNTFYKENENIDAIDDVDKIDPAEADKELEEKLLKNKKIGDEKKDKIFFEFALKQDNNEDFEVEDQEIDQEEEESDDDDESKKSTGKTSIGTLSSCSQVSTENDNDDETADEELETLEISVKETRTKRSLSLEEQESVQYKRQKVDEKLHIEKKSSKPRIIESSSMASDDIIVLD